MSLKLGNTDLNRLFLGSTEINKAYLGVDIVFQSGLTGFVSTWETTTPLETIQMCVTDPYLWDWGDGATNTNTSHEYALANQYTIATQDIVMDFLAVKGDRTKVLSIENWGGFNIGNQSFLQCSNLAQITAQDAPTLVGGSFYRCFLSNASLVSISNLENWDFTTTSTLSQSFRLAPLFNSPFGVNNTTLNVSNWSGMFNGATGFNQDMSGLNYSSAITLKDFMAGKSSANYDAVHYDALLIKWDSQLVFGGFADVNITMGTIKYTAAGAAAHLSLVNEGFIFQDGGQV